MLRFSTSHSPFIILCCAISAYPTSDCITFQDTTLHCIGWNYITVYYLSLLTSTLHNMTVHYMWYTHTHTHFGIALQYTTLSTLHYFALHEKCVCVLHSIHITCTTGTVPGVNNHQCCSGSSCSLRTTSQQCKIRDRTTLSKLHCIPLHYSMVHITHYSIFHIILNHITLP